jgi:hypothetical protein
MAAERKLADERPGFMGKGVFSWNGRGYRFSQTPPLTLMSPSALTNDNPWIVLAGVLERAKGGDFSSLPLLMQCVRESDNPVLWRTCFDLLGDAGSMPIVKTVFHAFRNEIVEQDLAAYQRHVAYTLAQSLYLWAVPLMLDIYLGSRDRQETGIITVLLSRALEEDFGPVAAAALLDDEYRDLVTAKYNALCLALQGDSMPVLYGKLFSVKALTAHMLDTLRTDSPLYANTLHDRHLFEAATGIDCSRFFEKGELKPQRAMAILEEFLIRGGLEPFEDGARYFFGNNVSL